MDDPGTPDVKTARTSIAVLEAVAELDGAGISELARHLDRSKGGVYKHVHTLADLGYLVRQDDTYYPGIELWTLGTTVRDRLLDEKVTAVIDDLAASIGHAVTLVIYERGTAVVVYYRTPQGVDVAPHTEGERFPLHATAAGKAILAYLPQAEREQHLDSDLPAYTDATTTDGETLEAELDAVRQRRLANSHGEYGEGVECVAAPIVDAGGYPQGAIAVVNDADDTADGNFDADASLVVSASKSLENTMGE